MSSRRNLISKSPKIRVGITIGDPSGVGPSVTLQAVNALKGRADFVVIGDAYLLKGLSGARIIDLNNVGRKSFVRGRIKKEYGRASMEYLDKAMDLLKKKEIDCLVTAPISKEAINKAGFKYSGHTEYLLSKSKSDDLVMMLLNDVFRFSLVTRHLPLKDVSSALTKDKLLSSILITHKSLISLFGIKHPRMVICGLNPHASDNGLIGKEENNVIKPVIAELRKKYKVHCSGPLSADIAIAQAAKKKYDCVMVMYHDQALIPLKLSGAASGVNITLGLPFVRTSPLHGTAFDIAQSSKLINPGSMTEAIKLAIKCTLTQKRA